MAREHSFGRSSILGNAHAKNNTVIEFPRRLIADRFWGSVMIHGSVAESAGVYLGNALRMELLEQERIHGKHEGNSDNVMEHSKVPLQLSWASSCLPSTAVPGQPA